jgi:hypothetical protein
MSIVVYKNSVILAGNIVDDGEFFSANDHRVYKASFPGAELVNATPPHDGRWRYEGGEFFDLDEQEKNAAASFEADQSNNKQIMADAVRRDRAARLAASDWTQVVDAKVDQAAWAAYRQALRDVTSQAGFPWDVQWPEDPFKKSPN